MRSTVLFFAGIVSQLQSCRARLGLLGMAVLLLIFGLSRILVLPIAAREQVRDRLKRRCRIDADADGKLSGSERRLSTNLNALKDKHKIGMTDKHVWLIQPRQ